MCDWTPGKPATTHLPAAGSVNLHVQSEANKAEAVQPTRFRAYSLAATLQVHVDIFQKTARATIRDCAEAMEGFAIV